MSEFLDKTGLSYFWGKIKAKLNSTNSTVNSHISNKSNPHGVTKAQIELGNVDNTPDSAKSVRYATSAGSATNDSSGHKINTTYIKDVSISGETLKNSTLNYTIGDGNRVSEILDFLNMVYPVGSFYISADSTNPNKLFGGTWLHIMSKFKFTSNETDPSTAPVIIDHECDVWERTA